MDTDRAILGAVVVSRSVFILVCAWYLVSFPWLVAALAFAMGTSSLAAQGLTVNEEEVRAAYIYNLAKFVEWPASVLRNPGDPILIGVLADESFARTLKALLTGKKAQGRSFKVCPFDSPDDVEPTHILYVGSGDSDVLQRTLVRLGRAPVLLVGKHEKFIRAGGILNFYLQEETHLRFEICPRRAERLGLKINSNILRLARVVAEK